MTIASLAEVKAKFSAYIEACKTSPVVVTKNGKPAAFRTTSFGSVSKWDVLDYRRAPFLWEPATLEDLKQDVEQEQQRVLGTLEALKRWARLILDSQPMTFEEMDNRG